MAPLRRVVMVWPSRYSLITCDTKFFHLDQEGFEPDSVEGLLNIGEDCQGVLLELKALFNRFNEA